MTFTPLEFPHAESTALMFVRTWAETVLRQLERVEAAGLQRATEEHSAEAAEQFTEFGWDGDDLEAILRQQWAEEHMLLWGAHQLELWRARLDRERRGDTRPPDERLAAVRNALEHLDQADLHYDFATAPPAERRTRTRKNWALDKLDDELIPTMPAEGDALFGLISIEELRTRATSVVRTVEEDLSDAAHFADLERG